MKNRFKSKNVYVVVSFSTKTHRSVHLTKLAKKKIKNLKALLSYFSYEFTGKFQSLYLEYNFLLV